MHYSKSSLDTYNVLMKGREVTCDRMTKHAVHLNNVAFLSVHRPMLLKAYPLHYSETVDLASLQS